MAFTVEQINEIKEKLALSGVKDTMFPDAGPIGDTEKVAIIQNGKNRLMPIYQLKDYKKEDTVLRIQFRKYLFPQDVSHKEPEIVNDSNYITYRDNTIKVHINKPLDEIKNGNYYIVLQRLRRGNWTTVQHSVKNKEIVSNSYRSLCIPYQVTENNCVAEYNGVYCTLPYTVRDIIMAFFTGFYNHSEDVPVPIFKCFSDIFYGDHYTYSTHCTWENNKGKSIYMKQLNEYYYNTFSANFRLVLVKGHYNDDEFFIQERISSLPEPFRVLVKYSPKDTTVRFIGKFSRISPSEYFKYLII